MCNVCTYGATRDSTSVVIGVQSVVDYYDEWALIMKRPAEELPELTALESCNFLWLLGSGGQGGGAATLMTDGWELGASRNGPLGVWGRFRRPEMLITQQPSG